MKKISIKWFYTFSFLIYIFVVLAGVIVSALFFEHNASNFLTAVFSTNLKSSENIVEVVIDDISNEKYKWNTERYADLLAYFNKYTKSKVVGLDAFVPSFDKTLSGNVKYLKQISTFPNLVSGIIPDKNKDDFMKEFKKKFALDTVLKTELLSPAVYHGVKSPSPELRKNTRHYGSVLAEYSNTQNSILNRSIFMVKIDDGFYPSLPFKMYLLANNTNKAVIETNFVTVPKTGLKIPYTDSDGEFSTFVRFYKLNDSFTYPRVSAYQIIETLDALDKGITPKTNPKLYNNGILINPELFKDKTVFIGTYTSGPGADAINTPVQKRHPGMDIQAVTYDNFSSGVSLRNVSFINTFILFLFLCITTLFVITRQTFFKGLAVVTIIDVLYLILVIILALNGYLLSYATPVFCQFITAVFAYTFKYLTENRNKEMIKTAMGKYLSRDVMRKVVSNIESNKLGGKREIVTVLFSDIRGFTSLSEKMPAEDVTVILNEYFSEMVPIVEKYNGSINKFIGDAIMALFEEGSDHPQKAVKCAYEMLKRVEYLRDKWLFEGKPKIEIGIGINTGEVFIGNIGTEERMEYTVIGDTVNLASRIESYNKVYKTNLLVSASTYSYIADIADVIKIKDVQIRGKAKKMDIFEVLRIDTREK